MKIKSTNAEYFTPTPLEFPIVASSPYLDQAKTDWPEEWYDSVFYEINKCGFNVMNIWPSQSYILKIRQMAEKNNLKVIYGNSDLHGEDSKLELTDKEIAECKRFVTQQMNNPTLGGWLFKDEPKFSQLDEDSKLHKLYEIIQNLDPNHLIYINLYGGAGGADINVDVNVDVDPDSKDYQYEINRKKYELYVQKYQDVFKPSFFCYDEYPIVKNDSGCGLKSDFKQFYADLELFSSLSKETGRPFWAFAQSMAWCNGYLNNFHPVATLPFLRFEVFSALGYGAQGIVYWTYHQRENTSNEEYISAPIDINGNETPIWGYVKQVNAEIAAYNDVFYDCQLIECLHTINFAITGEDTLIPDGTCNLDNKTTFGPFSKIEREEGGLGFQISHLSTNGIDYMVFVNHDIEYDQEITLTSPDYNTILKLNLDSEFNLIEESVSGTNTYTVPAGGYMIFKWY